MKEKEIFKQLNELVGQIISIEELEEKINALEIDKKEINKIIKEFKKIIKKKMKILFICHQNVNRSKTAERIFKDEYETRSAGIFNLTPVTKEELEWADIVMVMEESLRREIGLRFPDLYLKKKIISLDIPDHYRYMQQELVDLLNKKVKRVMDEYSKN